MRYDSILDLIGDTPVVRINHLYDPRFEVWQKQERFNPGGSIKDRIGLAMIEDAEQRGLLKQGGVIVEPTSGNTGIGLALAAAVKGYRLIVVMPESVSVERRKLMGAYGAAFELTPREIGMKGAIAKAQEIVDSTPGAWMPMQFDNPANTDIHRRTTAVEIERDFPDGLDFIVTGVGTGGHITGVAEVLKPKWPGLKVYAVEPSASAVIAGGASGPHPIQGLGAGFVPGVMRVDVIDGVITVSGDEAMDYARRSAREEGNVVGISSGAALAAVAKLLRGEVSAVAGGAIPEGVRNGARDGARILTFSYDTGERYLSVEPLFGDAA